MHPPQQSEGFLDITDVCLAARGISYVLKEALATWNDSDSSTIQTIFRVARLLIRLPVVTDATGREESLLTWTRSIALDDDGASPSASCIVHFSRWMNSMARLLTNDGCLQVVQRIAMKANGDASTSSDTEASHRDHRWTTHVMEERDMNDGDAEECDVEAVKSMLENAEQLGLIEDALYPEEITATAARSSVKNVYAKRSVPVPAQRNSTGLATASEKHFTPLTLTPRCKRSAKEYIAKFIEMS